MTARSNPRPSLPVPVRPSALSWPLACALCLALLTGCSGDNRRGPDPLIGATPWNGGPGSTVVPSAPGAPPPSAAVPPAPTNWPTTSAGSTAALAASTGRPADARSGLQIGTAPTTTGPAPMTPPLRPPEPTARLTGASSAAPPRLVSYEQAQVALQGRGVKWQSLETGGTAGEWKFRCALPKPQNPNVSRTYEASGSTYLAAIQAVLDQIDREASQ